MLYEDILDLTYATFELTLKMQSTFWKWMGGENGSVLCELPKTLLLRLFQERIVTPRDGNIFCKRTDILNKKTNFCKAC